MHYTDTLKAFVLISNTCESDYRDPVTHAEQSMMRSGQGHQSKRTRLHTKERIKKKTDQKSGEFEREEVRGRGKCCYKRIAGLCGSCVIFEAGGWAVEIKEQIPVVLVICGLINIQCVGRSALPESTNCCPLRKAKKKSICDAVGGSGVDVCYENRCAEGI